MSNLTALAYSPEWYNVGDPDNPGMVIAYGVLAMCTVWRVEVLAERILFKRRSNLSISDLATLVTFRSSTWPEIIKWSVVRPQRSRISRRAVWSTILRSLITLIDITIIVASIPRDIPVLENRVGSSELSFKNDSVPLQAEVSSSKVVFCVQEALPYRGFSPSVTRQLCVTTRTVYNRQNQLDNLRALAPNSSDVFLFFQPENEDQLVIASGRAGLFFTISHTMLVENWNQTEGGTLNELPFRTLTYPLPLDIVSQASLSLLSHDLARDWCSNLTTLDGKSVIIGCVKTQDLNPLFVSKLIFSSMSTRAVSYNKGRLVKNHVLQLGVASRPRLCIVPALILFSFLCLLSFISRIFYEGNIMLQLWEECSISADIPNSRNPIFINSDKTLVAESALDVIGVQAPAMTA